MEGKRPPRRSTKMGKHGKLSFFDRSGRSSLPTTTRLPVEDLEGAGLLSTTHLEDPARTGTGRTRVPENNVGAFSVVPDGGAVLRRGNSTASRSSDSHEQEMEDEILVEASLVPETNLVHAEPASDPQEYPLVQICFPKRRGAIVLCLGIVLLLTITVTTGIVCSTGICDPSNSENNGADLEETARPFVSEEVSAILENESSMPSTMPTFITVITGDFFSTRSPSSTPLNMTDFGNVALPRIDLGFELPDYSILAMNESSSPQAMAYQWLVEHPLLDEIPNWRKQQLFALVTFYYTFNRGRIFWGEKTVTDWLAYDVNECNWGDPATQTVDCGCSTSFCNETNGNVTGLLFVETTNNFAMGTVIPPELSLLSSLRALRMLNGAWGADVSTLFPEELSQIPLDSIELNANRLRGRLPPEIGLYQNLTYLDLGDNRITGALPSQLLLLTNLQVLRLAENALSGTLPSEIGLLSNLLMLDVSSNPQLSGTIPSELALLSGVASINLYNTNIEGSIPQELCDLPGSMQNAGEDGVVVDCLKVTCRSSDCGACKCFQFSFSSINDGTESPVTEQPSAVTPVTPTTQPTTQANFVTTVTPTGTPTWISSTASNIFSPGITERPTSGLPFELPLYSLNELSNPNAPQTKAVDWIAGHPLLTTYPEWKQLQLFALASYFYSFMGERWTSEASVDWMSYDVDECFWKGIVCAGTPNRTISIELVGRDNAIDSSAKAPQEFRLLPSLERLSLEFLVSWGADMMNLFPRHLANLTSYSLEGNQLWGELRADELWLFSALTSLEVQQNRISGVLNPNIGLLTNLEVLHLFSNTFQGTLPTELGHLTKMRQLSVHGNIFSGSLPSEIGLLADLDTFNAASTLLSGTIPSEFGLLTGLSHLELQENLMSGNIPPEVCSLRSLRSFQVSCDRVNCTDSCPCTCYQSI